MFKNILYSYNGNEHRVITIYDTCFTFTKKINNFNSIRHLIEAYDLYGLYVPKAINQFFKYYHPLDTLNYLKDYKNDLPYKLYFIAQQNLKSYPI